MSSKQWWCLSLLLSWMLTGRTDKPALTRGNFPWVWGRCSRGPGRLCSHFLCPPAFIRLRTTWGHSLQWVLDKGCVCVVGGEGGCKRMPNWKIFSCDVNSRKYNKKEQIYNLLIILTFPLLKPDNFIIEFKLSILTRMGNFHLRA